MLPIQRRAGITKSGTPDRLGAKWKRNFANPDSELPAQAPVPTHRYKPREVRRQGYPRESRSPSRRVVVKLGSWSACADGAPRQRGAPSSYPRTPGRATPGDRPLQGPATASSRSFVGPMNRAGNPRHPFPESTSAHGNRGGSEAPHNATKGYFSGDQKPPTGCRIEES